MSRPVWGAWIEIDKLLTVDDDVQSRPVWGAWIEIETRRWAAYFRGSRPVWGAWIEIRQSFLVKWKERRAPYGARGLKLTKLAYKYKKKNWSRPVWGAWIEMAMRRGFAVWSRCRAPYGARGLKSIRDTTSLTSLYHVAPRMGRVD